MTCSRLRRIGRRQIAALPLALALAIQGRPRRATVAASRAVATPTSATPVNKDALASFVSFIDASMEQLGVTGAALAVVWHDEIVLLQGSGTRGLDDPAPLSPDTLLMVDSLTKPITTLLAATLVAEGRLRWETPVHDLLPEFRLGAADGTPVALADLFRNCAGAPRNDAEILFNTASITPPRLIAMAAELPVNAADGERFQYSNHLFSIGGYAAASATAGGESDLRRTYQAAMRERLLDPLGMARSTFSLEAATRDGDYATPAAPALTGEVRPVSLQGEETFANAVEPAGGLWSSAREMANFLQAQLRGGVGPGGLRLRLADGPLAGIRDRGGGADQRRRGRPRLDHGGAIPALRVVAGPAVAGRVDLLPADRGGARAGSAAPNLARSMSPLSSQSSAATSTRGWERPRFSSALGG